MVKQPGKRAHIRTIEHTLEAFQEIVGGDLEQVPLIEQSHVNAPKVGRMSHQIAVAGFAKGRVAGQVANDRIVLHFAQGYQSRRFPLAYGGDDAGDVVQFLPVFKFPIFSAEEKQKGLTLKAQGTSAVWLCLPVQEECGNSDSARAVSGPSWSVLVYVSADHFLTGAFLRMSSR